MHVQTQAEESYTRPWRSVCARENTFCAAGRLWSVVVGQLHIGEFLEGDPSSQVYVCCPLLPSILGLYERCYLPFQPSIITPNILVPVSSECLFLYEHPYKLFATNARLLFLHRLLSCISFRHITLRLSMVFYPNHWQRAVSSAILRTRNKRRKEGNNRVQYSSLDSSSAPSPQSVMAQS